MPELEFEKNILGQTELKKFMPSKTSIKSVFDMLDEVNWDFKDAKTQYLTHRFHSYPARFIPQIPRTFIKLFTAPGDIVLDPFAGCGTTLVEAKLLKRYAIGNDLNPLATLISKVKITALSDDQIKRNKLFLERLENKIKSHERSKLNLPKLPNRKISNIFTRIMLEEIQILKKNIDGLKDDKDLFDFNLVALSSTIRAIIESENGDNILKIFRNKTSMMLENIEEFSRYADKKTTSFITTGDSRNLKEVKDDSVNLIVTSPPYVNALDYYRVHMYNMLWLGMNYNAFKQNEIGGHSHHLNNRFRLLSEYLGDMLRSMIEMNRVLKKRMTCAIVVGNSSIDYELIESYKHFSSMSKRIGFDVKKIIFRNIDKSSKYFSNGKIDDEFIVLLQKVNDSKYSNKDDHFITEVVTNELKKFRESVKNNPGSSTRGKEVSSERLLKNIDKIDEAIHNVAKDVRFSEA